MNGLIKKFELHPVTKFAIEGSLYTYLTNYYHLNATEQLVAAVIVGISVEGAIAFSNKFQSKLAERKLKKELADKERLFKWLDEYNGKK